VCVGLIDAVLLEIRTGWRTAVSCQFSMKSKLVIADDCKKLLNKLRIDYRGIFYRVEQKNGPFVLPMHVKKVPPYFFD